MDILKTHTLQTAFFNSNKTKNIEYRIEVLKKLKHVLKSNETLLYDAIYKDFGKSEFETYISELSLVYHEINNFIKNLKKWSKPKKVSTGLVNFPGKSYIISEPLGVTLVIGAWNYPYQLSLVPAITALAAGNTVILKPSELPINTSNILANLINTNFNEELFSVIEGGVKETTALLEQKFDKIFFTGSTNVGKIIYKAAAKNLTPVTLELGGKSPAFILADADIKTTVKRLVWAKFLNAGQTCVAPDYIVVDKKIESEFLKELQLEIKKRYNHKEGISDNYTQIIDEKNFNRIKNLIVSDKIYYGGETIEEKRIIQPTILHPVTFEDEIMQDEIFGPLLPIVTFQNLEDIIQKVKENPKPLSCYIYGKNKKDIQKILNEISFGGGAINDSVIHLTNSKLPFGGVGSSGLGNYHGKNGFDTFSHQKSILKKYLFFEPNIKYTPYTKFKLKIIKFLLE